MVCGGLWAETARVLALEIFRVATWEGTCTFAMHYRLTLSGYAFGTAVLETAACTRSGHSQR